MVEARPDGEKFTDLPEFNDSMPSDSYSGYLKASDTKFLHYVFVTS